MTPARSELYRRSSPESLRRRFFGHPGAAAIDAEISRLTRPASEDHDVVLAEHDDRVVGVASYERPAQRAPEGGVRSLWSTRPSRAAASGRCYWNTWPPARAAVASPSYSARFWPTTLRCCDWPRT